MYSWQPFVLSTDIVGAEPCKIMINFKTIKKHGSEYNIFRKEYKIFLNGQI